jgi:hypothetical protein
MGWEHSSTVLSNSADTLWCQQGWLKDETWYRRMEYQLLGVNGQRNGVAFLGKGTRQPQR